MEQPLKRSRNKTDSPTKDRDFCVTCKKKVTTDGVECQWCTQWEHKVCSKITENEYQLLDGISVNIMFFCSRCCCKVPMALNYYDLGNQMDTKLEAVQSELVKSIEDKSIQQLEKFEVALSNRFSHLKDELNSLSAKIGSSVQDITRLDNQIKGSINKGLEKYNETVVVTLNDRLNSLVKSDTPGMNDKANLPMKSVNQLATTIVTEQREKERRQANLIFHNIDESVSKEPQVRKQHDINEISKLLSECINVKCSIKNALRIGKRGQREKPRLLKITFASIEDKVAVLRNKSQLRGEGVSEYIQNIYITPDLTPTEQENNKKLRQELNTLNKDGKKYMIKNGVIVQKRV